MKTKPDFKQHVQFASPRSGCGMGCWSIGCMGVIGLFVLMGVGGYYGVFHSSLPLRMIEAAIESEGEVEIEGLKGSLSSGFSADEFRFKTMDDRWSNLTDIKFNYESNSSLFGTDRIIITELSVDGGTIYADWDPEESEFEPEVGKEFEEIEDEFEDMDQEFRKEFGGPPDIGEVRIDLVRVANLRIVNPRTELEITIDEIKFDGFEWRDGGLKSLGELLVRSSQMELSTVPSVEFADQKHAQRLEGILRAQADHRLRVDVPFVIDFAVSDKLEVSLKSRLFDDQLQFDRLPEESELRFRDFSPAEIVQLDTRSILPANVNLVLVYPENAEIPAEVNADGSFELGSTKFSKLRIERPEQGPPVLLADAAIGAQTVTAKLRLDRPFWESWKVSLESETFESQEEIWSQTLFHLAYDQLSEDQQATVQAALVPPEATDAKADDVESERDATEAEAAGDEDAADAPGAEADDDCAAGRLTGARVELASC